MARVPLLLMVPLFVRPMAVEALMLRLPVVLMVSTLPEFRTTDLATATVPFWMTGSFATLLIVTLSLASGTPADQLVGGNRTKQKHGISEEEITRMEKEMESLERDYRLHQDSFGENSLHLNAAQRYVKRLLENARVRRFLTNRYPELLEEFEELAALESL